jgi:hypothetical protein
MTGFAKVRRGGKAAMRGVIAVVVIYISPVNTANWV